VASANSQPGLARGSAGSADLYAMTPSHTPSKIAKVVAAAAAIVALAFGANAIANGDSSSTTANGAQTAAGRPGNGGPPGGMGTAVTGATLTKLEAVATAKYPGTVEQAMKLSDGSYVVHVVQSGSKGEVHVLVSKAFEITGTQKGGPPGGGAPPSGSAPPTGTSSSSSQS
jgi:hypothetical protein